VIWNPKNKSHSNRNLVNDAWKKIEQGLSASYDIAALKKKESLMLTFRPLHQKVKKIMRTGIAPDNVSKPNWIAYNKMDMFLRDVYEKRTTINTELCIYFITILFNNIDPAIVTYHLL